jgi:hypothetical protein
MTIENSELTISIFLDSIGDEAVELPEYITRNRVFLLGHYLNNEEDV